MKRRNILIIVITILMLIVSTDYVFAASGLSKAEKSILEKLRVGAVVDDTEVHIPVSYINQVENEFIKNEVDITDKQADVIIGKVDEALEIVKTTSFKDLIEMKNTDAALQLLKLVDEAAAEINYKVTVNLADLSINITNPEGDTVFLAKNSINQTGFNMVPTMIVGSAFLTTILICYIIIIKNKSFFKDDLVN